jgi:hypothetical protein
LAQAGVKEGDVLRLQPEITAGGTSSCHEEREERLKPYELSLLRVDRGLGG